jgi:DHA1 family bicyclomycin/chloramphenicol resistance-like MFS transporter
MARPRSPGRRPAQGDSELALTWVVLATIALLSAVAPLATDMYLPVFPQVAAEFATSASTVQLTLTLFMVGMGIGQLLWGPISDRWGRRAPLLCAGILFIAASVVAPLSPSIGVLVATRFVQGFTGSAGMVIGRAVTRDFAHGVALARAMSLLGIIGALAPIVAPIAGGLLAAPIGWRGILWVIAGISVLMLACSTFLLRESLPPAGRRAGGVRDTARSVAAVLSDRRFVGYSLTQAFGGGVLFAFISGSSFVLQNEYGLSATHYSWLFALNALTMIVGGVLNARLVARHSPAQVLSVALVISVVATLAAAAVTTALSRPSLWLLLPLVAAASLCIAPNMANTTTLGLDRHGANAGMAAAVMGALQAALSGVVSQMVSITGQASAVSMTLVMAGSAVLAVLSYLALCRPRPRLQAPVDDDDHHNSGSPEDDSEQNDASRDEPVSP